VKQLLNDLSLKEAGRRKQRRLGLDMVAKKERRGEELELTQTETCNADVKARQRFHFVGFCHLIGIDSKSRERLE